MIFDSRRITTRSAYDNEMTVITRHRVMIFYYNIALKVYYTRALISIDLCLRRVNVWTHCIILYLAFNRTRRLRNSARISLVPKTSAPNSRPCPQSCLVRSTSTRGVFSTLRGRISMKVSHSLIPLFPPYFRPVAFRVVRAHNVESLRTVWERDARAHQSICVY